MPDLLVFTAAVTNAWAFTARQSGNRTASSKVLRCAINLFGGISLNKPLLTRSAATIREIFVAISFASTFSASNSGIANFRGSITPWVIFILSGPGVT